MTHTAPKKNNQIFWVLRTLLGFYVIMLLIAFIFQRNLMYHPNSTPFVPKQITGLEGLEPFEIETENGERLVNWLYKPMLPDQPTVVYFQGNAGSLKTRDYKFHEIMNPGYGLVLVGYRGYGNPGRPSEEGLYRDARELIEKLGEKGLPPGQLVLYGESMGTGIAVQMALEYPVRGLILEAPYTSFADVGQIRFPYFPVQWLVLDRYENKAKISKIKAPVLVVHGEADRTIPIEHGKAVFEAAPEPKKAVFYAEAGHGNLYDYGMGKEVTDFIAQLPAQ